MRQIITTNKTTKNNQPPLREGVGNVVMIGGNRNITANSSKSMIASQSTTFRPVVKNLSFD